MKIGAYGLRTLGSWSGRQLLLSLAFCLALVSWPSVALANTYYSYSENTDGQQYLGAFGTWQNSNMYLADYSNGQFIASVLWLYVQPDSSQWVEVGLRNSYEADVCNCVAYSAFWADTDRDGAPLYVHTIANTSPDGSSHNYEVQRASNPTYWNVYRDYNYVGQSTIMSGTLGYYHDTGGEIYLTSSLGPQAHSNTFDMYSESKNTSGNWYYWYSHVGLINNGCGSYPQGYCLNGYAYYNYEWSWNKP